jgi:hypothetical protein
MATTVTETADQLTVNLASATGSSDALALEITAVTAANDVLNLDAAGVETLTLSAKNTTNSLTLDVAGVTATSGSTVGITSSGGGALVFNAINTGTNSIDASTMTGAITVDAAQRGNGAMTIKGGTGGDTIEMENAADVLSGGLGTDSLNITHTGILGGIAVDLTATDQVTTFDTVANSAAQSGFENVDVSGYTNFGASITGTTGANTIIGTASIDSITGGLGADVITGGGGADIIVLTETTSSADEVNIDAAADFGDTISGFVSGTDDIDYNIALDPDDGTTIAAGALVSAEYLAVTGAAATNTITGNQAVGIFEFANAADQLGAGNAGTFDLTTATAAELKADVIDQLATDTAVALTDGTTSTHDLLFVMYDEAGNAGIIRFEESDTGPTAIGTADTISLVAVLTDIALGGIAVGDII